METNPHSQERIEPHGKTKESQYKRISAKLGSAVDQPIVGAWDSITEPNSVWNQITDQDHLMESICLKIKWF
jgi:hypothetical protein